jgi:hypothetical protein
MVQSFAQISIICYICLHYHFQVKICQIVKLWSTWIKIFVSRFFRICIFIYSSKMEITLSWWPLSSMHRSLHRLYQVCMKYTSLLCHLSFISYTALIEGSSDGVQVNYMQKSNLKKKVWCWSFILTPSFDSLESPIIRPQQNRPCSHFTMATWQLNLLCWLAKPLTD